jgi:hypothetical protein
VVTDALAPAVLRGEFNVMVNSARARTFRPALAVNSSLLAAPSSRTLAAAHAVMA